MHLRLGGMRLPAVGAATRISCAALVVLAFAGQGCRRAGAGQAAAPPPGPTRAQGVARSQCIVRELDFLALQASAGRIVHGRCTSRQEYREAEPVPYIEYTFKVFDAPKGLDEAGLVPGEAKQALASLTVRHACDRPARLLADDLEAAPLRLGVPEYAVGDEVVLFLTPPSSLGLSAPVGLGQGVFRVVRDGNVARVRAEVRTGRLFAGVPDDAFAGLAPEERPSALLGAPELGLDTLLRLSRSVKR